MLGAVHREIGQVQEDNVGVEAASSLGGITVDGRHCGKTASRPGKVPLALHSTTGDITVTTL